MTKERLNEIIRDISSGLAPRMTEEERKAISWTYMKFYPFRPAEIIFKINYEYIKEN